MVESGIRAIHLENRATGQGTQGHLEGGKIIDSLLEPLGRI